MMRRYRPDATVKSGRFPWWSCAGGPKQGGALLPQVDAEQSGCGPRIKTPIPGRDFSRRNGGQRQVKKIVLAIAIKSGHYGYNFLYITDCRVRRPFFRRESRRNRPCGLISGNAGKGACHYFLLTGMLYGVSRSLGGDRGSPTHLTTAADTVLDPIGRIPRYARIDITHSKAEQ